ncbi:TetR family transcriptional regulator [Sulfitobacter sp. JL08]|uniref:TetR family transcriptional regulator C-terminal domain-containing protein n=1 Tax=Sulfitobacter sp. JL08 TaxID=2070369 RepID=UPI000E0C1CAB|nr:TetR family transcriptional regulator C-terminal domain-containing protein [Sulfitobacter sp. JL08]AXI56410.1 TetR family transcriptional regulator [Sulfitobacter sp. JL08]
MKTTETETAKPRKERKANADKRRQQLLDATLRSIVANGLTKTTLATVANEASLSQGVAVFYFKSKTGLLTEALREQYRRYEENWQQALAAAGPDHLDQLLALIRADFAPQVCNSDALSIWFAFWGEQNFTPSYADVSAQFDIRRSQAVRNVCERLLADDDQANPARIAEWIDGFTDAFWQRLHLFPKTETIENALESTFELVQQLLPDHAERIRKQVR